MVDVEFDPLRIVKPFLNRPLFTSPRRGEKPALLVVSKFGFTSRVIESYPESTEAASSCWQDWE